MPIDRSGPSRPWVGWAIPAALVVASAGPGLLQAQKADVLTLPNGDRITGEIKGVSRGKLEYSTDDAGRLSIEWVKVARLTSPHSFEFKDRWGRRRVGRLGSVTQDGLLAVDDGRPDTLRVVDVVEIIPLDAKLLQRISAFLDMGFSFAKSNNARTLSLGSEVGYRGPKLGAKVSFDSYVQGQDSVPMTTRNTLRLQGTRFLSKRWSFEANAGVEQNDELNLAERFTGGGGLGRQLQQSNRGELLASAGLVVTRERFALDASAGGSADTSTTNLEGRLYLDWELYRFDSPELSLATAMTLFPSLSTLGRVRGELSMRLKYEVLSDFFVGVNLSDTFDSHPPDANASNNDFVISLSIGWSYRR